MVSYTELFFKQVLAKAEDRYMWELKHLKHSLEENNLQETPFYFRVCRKIESIDNINNGKERKQCYHE